jgi:hypothetical protein
MFQIEERHSMQGTKIGQVGPFRFYECPRRGDEAPLLMRGCDDGKWYQTGFWELPSLEEIYDEITEY